MKRLSIHLTTLLLSTAASVPAVADVGADEAADDSATVITVTATRLPQPTPSGWIHWQANTKMGMKDGKMLPFVQ